MSIDAAIGEVIDTIVAIRNARAQADVAAGEWLETHLAVGAASRPTFVALAPAIGRLARVRPLELHAGAVTLPRPSGALEVVLPTGSVEAVIVLAASSDQGSEQDQVRLGKELADAEGHLASARARLANAAFTDKAPPAVVAGARTRAAELAEQVMRLRERLGR